MKKAEIISLATVVTAFSMFGGALLLDYGTIRSILIYTGILFFLFSMFGYQLTNRKINRVEKALIIIVLTTLAGMILYAFIYILTTEDWLLGLIGVVFFSIVPIFILLHKTSAKNWFSNRLTWMNGSTLPIDTITVAMPDNKKDKLLYAESKDKTVSYYYHRREKVFFVNRKYFTNPLRNEKEYYERTYQFKTRMEQSHLPFRVLDSGYDNPFFFVVTICAAKEDATKNNLAKLNEILIQLAEEDQLVHISAKIEDEIWFIEAYRDAVVRACVFSSNLEEEPADNESEKTVTYAKYHPTELLSMIHNGENIDCFDDIVAIPKEYFEHVFSRENNENN